MNQVVPPGFLFRWSIPIPQVSDIPRQTGRLLGLAENFRLPSLGELDSKQDFADIRVAWNLRGIGISLQIRGRTRKPICSPEEHRSSEGLTIWIDTRNTPGVHRATRFCHQFCLFPSGGGPKQVDPAVVQIPLARAREETTLADVALIKIQSEVERESYWLDAWIPKEVLTGFDPSASSKLGFQYLVNDLEHGRQSLAVGTEFPIEADPSLWQTLELSSAP